MGILTRYVLRAHAGPFLFSLSLLTGLLLVNTVARRFEELAGKGLGAVVIGEVFLLSIPHILALTLPMAVLVAVLHAFSQLTAENEVSALKANGVSLVRLVMPLIGVATILAGVMVIFNDRILPETNHALKNLLVDIGRKSPTIELKEQVINEIQTGDLRTRYFLQAAKIDPATNRLTDVVIYDLSTPGRGRTVYADSGHMAFNQERTDLFLTLYDGWVNETEDKEPQSFQRLYFDKQLVRMAGVGNELQRTTTVTYRSDREMSLAMLAEEVSQRRVELAEVRARVAEESRRTVERTLDPQLARWSSPGATNPGRDEAWREPPPRERFLRAPAAEPVPHEPEATLRPRESGMLMPDGTRLPVRDTSVKAPALDTATAIAMAAGEPFIRGRGGRQGTLPPSAGPPGARTVTPAAASAQRIRAGRPPVEDEQLRRTVTELRSLNGRANILQARIWSYEVEYHKKYAIPFACIVFVLIGAPLAVRFPRGGIGFVIAASLSIFMIYYVGLIGGENLADDGRIPPFWAMWGTNALFLGLGVWGMSRLGKEMSTSRGGGWDDLWFTVRRTATRLFRRRGTVQA